MADIVLRHVTYVILLNPNLMPWQVCSVSLSLLARQLGDRVVCNSAKQHSKQQRENSNSDVSDFKIPNFTGLHWSPPFDFVFKILKQVPYEGVPKFMYFGADLPVTY